GAGGAELGDELGGALVEEIEAVVGARAALLPLRVAHHLVAEREGAGRALLLDEDVGADAGVDGLELVFLQRVLDGVALTGDLLQADGRAFGEGARAEATAAGLAGGRSVDIIRGVR